MTDNKLEFKNPRDQNEKDAKGKNEEGENVKHTKFVCDSFLSENSSSDNNSFLSENSSSDNNSFSSENSSSENNLYCCSEWSSMIERVLFSEEKIQRRVRELAAEISYDYKTKGKILTVGLLNGAFVFVGDLLKHLMVPYEVDFMICSSYGKSLSSSGNVKLKKDLFIDPRGRHILIIEDMIDTGNTLSWLLKHLATKSPASIRLCALLDKKSRRETPVHIDYVGFECSNEFVVGYGMDYSEMYRCLPFIAVLKSEAYS